MREISNTSPAPRFVVSAPHGPRSGFKVEWAINPHMQVGAVDSSAAIKQHDHFQRELRLAGADLLQVPFVHEAYDSVFVKDNAVLVYKEDKMQALLAKLFCSERRAEQLERCRALQDLGFEIVGTATEHFEGGDLVVVARAKQAFLGYGFRSDPKVSPQLAKFLNMEVIPLELVDPHCYHLDTALAVLQDGSAFAYRGAFTQESWENLRRARSIKTLTCVDRQEALRFALNMVEIEDTVVVGSFVPRVIAALQALGKKVRVIALRQFQFAGGSAACLTARIHDLR